MVSLILSLILSVASAKQIRIAVVDTGYSNSVEKDVNLCSFGHADIPAKQFNTKKPPADSVSNKHGTNVAYLINNQLKDLDKSKYCIIVIKFYQPGRMDLDIMSLQAIAYAGNIGADVINYSAGGKEDNKEESKIIRSLLNRGVVFIAAAGNDGSLLAKNPCITLPNSKQCKISNEKNIKYSSFYPAQSDPRIVVVGNLYSEGVRNNSSNYGSVVDVWENGTNVTGGGVTLTGSSQATAVATGKMVRNMIVYKNKGRK